MTSEDNMTRLWMEHDLAASSGYSLTDAVAICVASTLLMATIVIGNVLVIIAIFNERELNSEQNWDDDYDAIHTHSAAVTFKTVGFPAP